jgi:hypothetical protein
MMIAMSEAGETMDAVIADLVARGGDTVNANATVIHIGDVTAR